MKKKILIAVSYLLILALGIAGTYAYLTDEDEVNNTFLLSENIDITMDEAEVEKVGDDYVADDQNRVAANVYEDVYPGAVMPKDPTIHVGNGEDVYVRALVTVQNGKIWLNKLGATYADAFTVLVDNSIGADWSIVKTEENGNDVVVTLLYANRLNEDEDATPVFERVVLPAVFEYADMEVVQDFEVNVLAQAIQAAGFDSAAEAFDTADNM